MADTLDILSLSEGRVAINVPDQVSSIDTELAQFITAVSRVIDDEVGPVVQRTVTAEVHPGGYASITLRNRPIVSVTTVRTTQGGSISTISAVPFGTSAEGYYLDPLNSGVLYRRVGTINTGWDSTYEIEVTYVAGRYANTAAVDAQFKACAAAILRRLWKREAGTWAQSPDFFEQIDTGNVSTGFYRAAKPIIDEMLGRKRKLQAIG